METILTRVGPKHRIVIPERVRKATGLNIGDFLETKVRGTEIILRPKVVVDKVFIEARLREGQADIRAGRVAGPFKNHKELIRYLHKKRRGK